MKNSEIFWFVVISIFAIIGVSFFLFFNETHDYSRNNMFISAFSIFSIAGWLVYFVTVVVSPINDWFDKDKF